MNRRIRTTWLIGVILGMPVGMILMAALVGVLPLLVALPGRGERCTKCHDLHGGDM